PESRKFVKWAMDAKKGQVSPMMQDDKQTYLIAMAVKDIYNDYIPYTAFNVYPQLRSQALNAKKAARLAKDYAGKGNTVAEYAAAMGTEVQEGDVTIISPAILTLGVNESAIQGAITAAEKGKVSGPVAGNRSVIVFEVKDIDTANRPFTEAEYGQRFLQTYGLNRRQSPLPLLLGKEHVENLSLNFVQSPVE
ncbi:MAG: peptidyl-prolyl cis-trans isomerase, partial [Muribaculaceae bacterium]|nr:peptidyl-prolyl cis-trans isomerase [Muribaculaceae bacterium]